MNSFFFNIYYISTNYVYTNIWKKKTSEYSDNKNYQGNV